VRARRPEWVPHIELLLCVDAAAFTGTVTSTFSASVLAQRDVLGRPRNTTSFFGLPLDVLDEKSPSPPPGRRVNPQAHPMPTQAPPLTSRAVRGLQPAMVPERAAGLGPSCLS